MRVTIRREDTDLAPLTLGAVKRETAPSKPGEEPGDRLPVDGAVAGTRACMSRERSPGVLAARRRNDGASALTSQGALALTSRGALAAAGTRNNAKRSIGL